MKNRYTESATKVPEAATKVPEAAVQQLVSDGTVTVAHVELCGDRPAKYVREGEDVYCDVCGKASDVVSHSHEYRYEGDARLHGEDWETGERRELTAEEAHMYLYDGDVLGLDDVSGEA